MDANEIIKAAPAIAKVAGPLAAAVPFTAIVKRMLGPAADELAEMWRDQVRLYRYERQLKCVEKAERMAQEAGFTPQAVPPKILFPLLEGASFEEDESLHDMWAALLANVASPDHADRVRLGFIAMLKQMSPDEAALLNWTYDTADNSPPLNQITLMEAYARLGFGPKDACDRHEQVERSHTFLQQFAASRDSLEAARLLRRNLGEDQQTRYSIGLTGRAFVLACRPPKPKK
jgi:Abortive infection alpha